MNIFRILKVFNPMKGMDKKIYQSDRMIWLTVVLLWLISILIVYSTAGSKLIDLSNQSTSFLIRQLAFILMGFVVVYTTHKIHYTFYMKYAFVFYWGCVGLLVCTLLFGVEINGAKRWLMIPFIHLTFQPSDLAKIAMVIFLSKKISQYQEGFATFQEFLMTYILPVLLIVILIIPENLSTSLLILCSSFILLFIGRAQTKYLLKSIFLVCILPILLMVSVAMAYYDTSLHQSKPLPALMQVARIPTWLKRIQGFIYDNPQSENYQIQQANIAIASGGVFGVGPGNSEQRYFLPSSYADYIYSIWVEEYGLLGGVLLLSIYLFLFYRSMYIFIHCSVAFGAFVAVGLSLSFVFQALVNILVNVNLIPNTGVPLPLVSVGGTSYLMSCFAIGVILSVAKYIQLQSETQVESVQEKHIF